MIHFQKEVSVGECIARTDITIDYKDATAAEIAANDMLVRVIAQQLSETKINQQKE